MVDMNNCLLSLVSGHMNECDHETVVQVARGVEAGWVSMINEPVDKDPDPISTLELGLLLIGKLGYCVHDGFPLVGYRVACVEH